MKTLRNRPKHFFGFTLQTLLVVVALAGVFSALFFSSDRVDCRSSGNVIQVHDNELAVRCRRLEFVFSLGTGRKAKVTGQRSRFSARPTEVHLLIEVTGVRRRFFESAIGMSRTEFQDTLQRELNENTDGGVVAIQTLNFSNSLFD